MSYTCETFVDGAALLVPLSGLSTVTVDGLPPSQTREVELEGKKYLLVGLEPGKRSIEVVNG